MALSIDLANKVVVICGGSGDIGAAVSNATCAAGAQLLVVDRTNELVDETLARMHRLGGAARGLVADLSEVDASEKIIACARKELGRVDGLVNVAGGTKPEQWCRFEDTSDEIFRSVFRLNFDYIVAACRGAARVMIETASGGSIVNFASVSGITSAPFHGHYGAAKAGLISLGKTMAAEWHRHGIRVNAISPGIVATRRVLDRGFYELSDELAGRQLVFPEEIGNVCAFLLSNLAQGITGQNIVVDLGLTNRWPGGGLEKAIPRISRRPAVPGKTQE
jgi:NAD(P)-dependent dehydrogenase (short-subunit alcohol dehydrogenase family)